jgi:hypothetical protein
MIQFPTSSRIERTFLTVTLVAAAVLVAAVLYLLTIGPQELALSAGPRDAMRSERADR